MTLKKIKEQPNIVHLHYDMGGVEIIYADENLDFDTFENIKLLIEANDIEIMDYNIKIITHNAFFIRFDCDMDKSIDLYMEQFGGNKNDK